MSTPTTYRERLLWAMQKAEITSQSELARRVGVKPQSIQHLVDPKKNAQGSAHTAKIAEVLNVSPNWLASGEGSPNVIVVDESHRRFGEISNLVWIDSDTNQALKFSAIDAHGDTPTPAQPATKAKTFGEQVKELSAIASKYSDRTREHLAMTVAYMLRHGPDEKEAAAIDALLDEAVVNLRDVVHELNYDELHIGSFNHIIPHEPLYSASYDFSDAFIKSYAFSSKSQKQGVSTLLTKLSEKEPWELSNREMTLNPPARTGIEAETIIGKKKSNPMVLRKSLRGNR